MLTKRHELTSAFSLGANSQIQKTWPNEILHLQYNIGCAFGQRRDERVRTT